MKVYPILSIVLILLGGCQDDTYHTIVRGTVIHDGTKEPIEGVLIRMKDGVASSFFGVESNTSSGAISETYSDENGHFEISLKGEHRAVLGASKENYFDYKLDGRPYGTVIPFSDGTHENVIIAMAAEAHFNGIFFSKKATPDDQVQIFVPGGGSPSVTGEGEGPFSYSKADREGLLVYGDKYLPYEIQYYREGSWNTIEDSVYIKSFIVYRDTIYY